jgi:hypothetical protein
MFEWVMLRRAAEVTGLSVGAIEKKVQRGVWLEGVQWRRAPDGRRWFSLPAIKAWIEGTTA